MDHIFLSETAAETETYFPQGGRRDTEIPARDRAEHSARLKRNWRAIWAKYDEGRAVGASDETARERDCSGHCGLYFDFVSSKGYEIAANSLENHRFGITIANVAKVDTGDGPMERVTIFVPENRRAEFERKIVDYAEKETEKTLAPKNKKLIESIDDLMESSVESLWRDDLNLMPRPGGDAVWCEVWLVEPEGPLLRNATGESVCVMAFKRAMEESRISVKDKTLRFPERSVCLVYASYSQLVGLMERFGNIGEFRRAKDTAEFFMNMPNAEQVEWERDLLQRVRVAENPTVAVSVLDTGATLHPLLHPVLQDEDRLAVNPSWSVNDVNGHGTGMCGLAAYGDLIGPLARSSPVHIEHAIESVKILPDRGENDKELYGRITQEGMYRAEISGGQRKHIGCMAVTTVDGRDRGNPSSWSAAIDQMTSGAVDGVQRLFIVSAGNVDAEADRDYPNANVNFAVCDPAQSWNAVTVGAYTDKTHIERQSLSGYSVVAAAGELSPFSATSVMWDVKKWPIKPDILMEGGNLARSPSGDVSSEDDVCLLTTSNQPLQTQFQWFNGTSAATALASRMAAQIASRYPQAWPETIRGLMIHSARWTDALMAQYKRVAGIDELSNKADYVRLAKFAGYGVPNLKRALDCASNELTLIAQAEIQPFKEGSTANEAKCNEIDFYKLPWPKDVLLGMGEAEVTLRVTLSYFIEPSPGEVGWNDRYKYPSHMLRFDVNNPTEDLPAFKRRLNKQTNEDDQPSGESDGGSERWTIGKNGHKFGSVHTDFIKTTAADLATCNLIGVAPVGGWWKTRTKFGRYNSKARYSLIVSLEADSVDCDIYTPVYNIVNVPVTMSVSV